uniref:Leucine-, glutamate- and lysine-rich protein 1 n=1 Tax=Phallusia mammillata TaxID=59560 RepID=A0A6F9DKC8_9ASCI|nr:putative protein tag-278 [Phallusia mammillata]
MKPAKIKPLSPILERHTPQHPLPEELKELSRDATVCQFCGVSYLIHHEIKKLEEKVAQLESELEKNCEAVEREPILRAELEKNKLALLSLDVVLKEKDSIIQQITKEIETLKDTNESLSHDLQKRQNSMNKAKSELRAYKTTVKDQLLKVRGNVHLVKADVEKMKQTIPNELLSAHQNLEIVLKDSLGAITKELKNEATDAINLEGKVKQLQNELNISQQMTIKAENQLEEQQKLISTFHQRQSAELETRDNKLALLTKSNEDLTKALKLSEIQIKSSQSQQNQLEEEVRKLQNSRQTTLSKLQKTEMNADLTIQRLNKECRQLKRDLSNQREEMEKMKEIQQKRQQQADEINREAHLTVGQMEQIKLDLDEAKSSQKALMHERELMVQSHQNQIEQLRESFKRKLDASNSLPLKAQQEMQAAEERHRNSLAELELKLKGDFQITLSVENDKHAEAMQAAKSKFQQDLRELQADQQKHVLPMKNKVSGLMQQIDSMTKRQEEKAAAYDEEKQSLMKIICQLEEKITKLTSEQEDHATFNKLETVAIQQKNTELLHRNEDLTCENVRLQEEINLLQDTVRRECEERFELTDALSHARDQLQIKNPGVALAQSFNSPVSALNKLNPGNMKKEAGFLSGQTMKNLEMDLAATSMPRGPGHTMPSLRSLPDILPKIEKMANGHPKLHSSSSGTINSTTVSTHVRDISFGNEDTMRRSQSSGANEQLLQKIEDTNLNRRITGLHQSKSADNVDTARRRIAAAVKRK